MNEVTVFVDEMAVTLPLHTTVIHAIRAYLYRRDPDLIKLMDRHELYVVDSIGHVIQENCFLHPGMRLYVRKMIK